MMNVRFLEHLILKKQKFIEERNKINDQSDDEDLSQEDQNKSDSLRDLINFSDQILNFYVTNQ